MLRRALCLRHYAMLMFRRAMICCHYDAADAADVIDAATLAPLRRLHMAAAAMFATLFIEPPCA